MPEDDLSFTAGALNDGRGVVEDLITNINSVTAEQQALAEKRAALGDQGASRDQQLFSILAAALPVAIGAAIGGKQGAFAGAAVGGTGAASFLNEIEEDRLEKKSDLDALLQANQKRLDALGDDKRAALQRQLDREINVEQKELDRQNRLASKSSINIDNSRVDLPAETIKSVAKLENTALKSQQIIDFIDDNFPKENIESLAGAKNLSLRKLAELNPDSPAAKLQTRLENAKLLMQEALVKGAASENDAKRVERMIEGKAPISSLGLVRDSLVNIRDGSLKSSGLEISTAQRLKAGEQRPRTLEEIQQIARGGQKPTSGADEIDARTLEIFEQLKAKRDAAR